MTIFRDNGQERQPFVKSCRVARHRVSADSSAGSHIKVALIVLGLVYHDPLLVRARLNLAPPSV